MCVKSVIFNTVDSQFFFTTVVAVEVCTVTISTDVFFCHGFGETFLNNCLTDVRVGVAFLCCFNQLDGSAGNFSDKRGIEATEGVSVAFQFRSQYRINLRRLNEANVIYFKIILIDYNGFNHVTPAWFGVQVCAEFFNGFDVGKISWSSFLSSDLG